MKIVALFLIFSMLLTLVGCRREAQYEKDIVFTDDVPIPEDRYLRAEEVFFCLLLSYVRQSGTSNPSEKLTAELRSYAERGALALKNIKMSSESFDILLDILERDGEAVVIEFATQTEKYLKMQDLYLTLSAHLGTQLAGEIIYELLSVYYDIQYEDNLEKYEKYGYTYLLEDANRYKADGETLRHEVGRDNFSSAIGSALAVGRLLFGTGFDENEILSFSDEELLLFVKSLDVSVSITERGWEYLLTRLSPMVDGVFGKYLSAMAENGDITVLSGVMNDAVELLSYMQSGLEGSDIAAIREGEQSSLLGACFARLDENRLEAFRRITSIELQVAEYEKICAEYYGEDYTEYADSLVPVSFEEFKASIGTDEFYESLKGYIGGISPAFSYGIER